MHKGYLVRVSNIMQDLCVLVTIIDKPFVVMAVVPLLGLSSLLVDIKNSDGFCLPSLLRHLRSLNVTIRVEISFWANVGN